MICLSDFQNISTLCYGSSFTHEKNWGRPWDLPKFLDMTIRQKICLHSAYNEEWYPPEWGYVVFKQLEYISNNFYE